MKQILIVLLLINGLSMAKAQVKGTITDMQGEKLPGVVVLIDDESKGISNENGIFSVAINGPADLTFSSIGYKSKVVSVDEKNKNLGTVVLTKGNELLQDIVIIDERPNKFSRKRTAYVAKLPLNDLENSQAYSTVTTELLESQLVTNLDDALKNASGVNKLWEPTGRAGDGAGYFGLRGFSVQPQLVNGVPGITNGRINSENIERIEVIKGPSATLYGSTVTSYGGLINVVTKKPFAGQAGRFSALTGSYGLARITGDYNAPVSEEKDIYFRVNTGYQSEDSWQDQGFNNSFFIAPSLSYKVNEDLSLSFYSELSQSEQTNPVMYFLNRSAPSAASNLDELNLNNDLSFTTNDWTIANPAMNFRGEMDYQLSDQWSSQTVIARSNAKSEGIYSYLYDYGVIPEQNLFTRFVSDQNARTIATTIQQNFIGDLQIGNIRNRIVAGIDYYNYHETESSSAYTFYNNVFTDGTVYSDNPFTPDTMEPEYPLTMASLQNVLSDVDLGPANNFTIENKVTSAYVSDVVNITPEFNVMAAVRFDHFNNQVDDFDQSTISPKFGAVWQAIPKQLSVFANYQNGFTNVAPQLVGNPENGPQTLKSFRPEQANQIEAGIKTDLFDERLYGLVTYYNIQVEDKVMTDPEDAFNRIQAGQVNSEGVEVEFNANPISRLNLHAGYSHNYSEVVKGDGGAFAAVGRRPLEAGPETLYNFWGTYDFIVGKNHNTLGFGLGMNHASENYVLNSPVTGEFVLPAYTIANASVQYDIDNFDFTLKVNNLLDENYYKGWSTINPQKPRAVIGQIGFDF